MRPSRFPVYFLIFLNFSLLNIGSSIAKIPNSQHSHLTNTYIANKESPINFIQEELYFGLSIPGGGTVTDEQWQTFLNEVVTPRFPEGLTVILAKGQYLEHSGVLAQETSKVIHIFYKNDSNAQKHSQAIDEIIAEYKQQFHQESVLRVTVPIKAKFE
jgi:hypothetical protein